MKKPRSEQECLACRHPYFIHYRWLDRDEIGCDGDHGECECKVFAVAYAEESVSFLPHHSPGVREFTDARSTQTHLPVLDPKRPVMYPNGAPVDTDWMDDAERTNAERVLRAHKDDVGSDPNGYR